MLRISATQIESFRRYLADPEMEKGIFIESLAVDFKPNVKMQKGTAFHSIIENPNKYKEDGFYSCNNHVFKVEDIETCLPYIDYAFPFEVKTTHVYNTDFGAIELVAKCDQLAGLKIIENKTKWSGFDYDTYYESCQWKIYNYIFEAISTKYNVFEFYCPQKNGEDNPEGIPTLRGVHQFVLPFHNNHNKQINNLINEFVQFIQVNSIESLFQKRTYSKAI